MYMGTFIPTQYQLDLQGYQHFHSVNWFPFPGLTLGLQSVFLSSVLIVTIFKLPDYQHWQEVYAAYR